MAKQTSKWDLDRLARESGVSQRTIRNWISQGLLPGPVSKGRYAEYSAGHLERIREIQRLKVSDEGITYDEIRRVLSGVGQARSRGTDSALSYLQSLKDGSSPGQPPSRPTERAHRRTSGEESPVVPDSRAPFQQGRTLDQLVGELQRMVRHRSVAEKSKAEAWVRIPITPDLEIGIRGTPSQEQLERFEQVADHLRVILLGGMRDD